MARQYTSTSLSEPPEKTTDDSSNANKQSADTHEIPNGGIHAWMQVLGSFFLLFNCWGLPNSFGVFQEYYEQQSLNGEVSSSAVSWIGSSQSFLLVAMSIFSGPLFDLGYFRQLLITGSFLVVFGMMMVSLCSQYWQVFLAQGIVVGLGCGFLLVPSAAIIPMYFSTKKAVAMGIATGGSSLGGIVFPIIFRQLRPQIGFGWTTRVMGFIALATLLIPLTILRHRAAKPQSRRRLVDLQAWKDPPYSLFNVAQFLGVMGVYIPFFYAGVYGAQRLGMPEMITFYLYSILNAGSLFGRIITGLIADRVGALNTLIMFTTAACILAFAWEAINNAAGMFVFCVLYGFFSGAFVTLPPTIIVTLSPAISVVGTRLGMSYALAAFGVLIGNPIAGAILGDGDGWTGLRAWCGACYAAALCFVIAARAAKLLSDRGNKA